MDPKQVVVGHDYWWHMPPREDGSPRRSVVRVTSEPRVEKVGRDGDREGYVVDAVFVQRDGTTGEATRYPVQIFFLQPVAYAQGLKGGDVVCWLKNRTNNSFTPPLTVDGPRDEETGKVPVIWHHDRESRDGTKPAGDSRHDVANQYLFRKETVDVMRATQPSAPQTRIASTSGTGDNRTPAAPTSGIDQNTFDLMRRIVADLAEQGGMAEDADALRGTLGKGEAYKAPTHTKR